MNNFKDTVYSILLGEVLIPGFKRPMPVARPRNPTRVDPDIWTDGNMSRPTTEKERASREKFNADQDAKDAQQVIDNKAFDDAKKTQATQDAAEALAAGKAAAAKMPAAMDNRRREEAAGMVASGQATSIGDARNRMGVRDQIAAERARMAKNPVREVGIASPSSQIGGAGTQYGNSPNRAPETEAEIQYRTGSKSAPTADAADIDPTTGIPKLFSARDNRNQKQKIIPGLDVPAQEAGPWHEFDVQNGTYDEKTETEDNQQYLPPAKTFKMDTTPGSEPGGWEGEDQGMADLHNTPAWQKMWAAGQDSTTRQNMEASQKRQDKGNTAIQTARDNGDSTLSGLEQKSRDTRLPSEGATTQNRRDHIDAIRAAEYEKGRLRRQANSKPSGGGEQPDGAGSGPTPKVELYSYNKALTFFAEQLKRKYIEEEVVNPENQPMTKSEISHRDKIRHKSPAKDAIIVKSADKTKENAEYRLATYITMRARKGKKKENK
jgi:hypothetical protein